MPSWFVALRNRLALAAGAIAATVVVVGCEEAGPRHEARRTTDEARQTEADVAPSNAMIRPAESNRSGGEPLQFPAMADPNMGPAVGGRLQSDAGVLPATAYIGQAQADLANAANRSPALASPAKLQSADRQAEEHNRRGFALATRGALFSARSEFDAALQTVAAARDGYGDVKRSASLTAATTALFEAEDFVPRGTRPAAADDLSPTLRAHRCGAIVAMPPQLSAAEAHACYMEFAVERFARAAAGSPPASVALHGLGKTTAAIAAQQPCPIADARSKARAYYEAALQVDAANFPAANDLAVLLAEEGRYEHALRLLHESLAVSRQPAIWNNVAAIYERMGNAPLAQSARLHARAAAQAAPSNGGVVSASYVDWVDPRAFASASAPGSELQRAPQPTTATFGRTTQRPVVAPATHVAPDAAKPPQRHILGN